MSVITWAKINSTMCDIIILVFFVLPRGCLGLWWSAWEVVEGCDFLPLAPPPLHCGPPPPSSPSAEAKNDDVTHTLHKQILSVLGQCVCVCWYRTVWAFPVRGVVSSGLLSRLLVLIGGFFCPSALPWLSLRTGLVSQRCRKHVIKRTYTSCTMSTTTTHYYNNSIYLWMVSSCYEN